MSEDKNQVGVIHEVGDFGLIGELSQEDQKAFKEKDKKENSYFYIALFIL